MKMRTTLIEGVTNVDAKSAEHVEDTDDIEEEVVPATLPIPTWQYLLPLPLPILTWQYLLPLPYQSLPRKYLLPLP